MKTVITEDGYRFTEQPDGTFTDGDMTFNSLAELSEAVTVTAIEKGTAYKLLVALPDKTLAEIRIEAKSEASALETAKRQGYDVLTIKLI
jgi:hypothetical protein